VSSKDFLARSFTPEAITARQDPVIFSLLPLTILYPLAYALWSPSPLCSGSHVHPVSTGCVKPGFMLKSSTHRMHYPKSIISYIRSKGFIDNQLSRTKYDYHYINSVSKYYDDSQQNGTAKDSITPQEQQPEKHIA
jgi:hypothetical protein